MKEPPQNDIRTFSKFNEIIAYSRSNPNELVKLRDYYHNGDPWEESTYLGGNSHGEYTCHYKDGGIQEKAQFHHGSQINEYLYYHLDGSINKHCFYINGILSGELKYQDIDGSISKHCFYLDGVEQPQLQYLTTERDEVTLMLLFGDNYIK